MSWASERSRSYTVQRTVPVGSRVTVTRTVRNIEPGKVVTVTGYVNAGTNGIEAVLMHFSGRYEYGISAGLLDSIDDDA